MKPLTFQDQIMSIVTSSAKWMSIRQITEAIGYDPNDADHRSRVTGSIQKLKCAGLLLTHDGKAVVYSAASLNLPKPEKEKPIRMNPTAPPMTRICLGPSCGKSFTAKGRYNRLCQLCSSKVASLSW